jgi:hypothetical protein
MTKNEEGVLMHLFMESYNDFPQGTVLKMNPPAADYLLSTSSGEKIGIELTEAFHNKEAKRISSDTYKFTRLVLEKLEKKLSFSFSIDIDINIEKGIPKSISKNIVNNTATFCINEFADLIDYEYRALTNINKDLEKMDDSARNMILSRGYRNLPKGVERIAISRHDSVSESWNSQGEGGPVPHFTDEYLRDILTKKEEKLKKYEPCNQFWLVIKEGNYYSGTFHDIQTSTPVDSSFHNIFICRLSSHEIVELK